MTAFSWVALVVAAGVHWGLPRRGVKSFSGSVLVGFVWPVLLVMAPYFWIKWRVLRRPSNPATMQLEIVGCTVAGLMGLAAFLWLTDDPLAQALMAL
jgi:hypothetical protein